MKAKHITVLLMAFALLQSCRQAMLNKAVANLQASLDTWMGHSKESVLNGLGSPRSRQTFGSTEVWSYFRGYGTVSSGGASAYSTGYGAAYAHGSSATWQQYDSWKIHFKDNCAVKYEVWCQR